MRNGGPGSSPNPLEKRVGVLYALFFLSGMAALIYEVMWMRSFSLVFGSTSRATAAVLGAFFAGLAVGGLLGARLATRRSVALWRYGIAEIAIGAGALLVDFWIGLFRDLYPSLYPLGGWVLGGSKLLLAGVAMGLPCVAMGATLPLVSRAIVAWPGHVGRRVGVAYALNTLGATAGVLLAGFVLPPAMGTRASVYLAVAINVASGVAAMLLSRAGRAEPASDAGDRAAQNPELPAQTEPARTEPARTEPAVLLVVAASGFGTVALEVLYTRLIVNSTDSSVFSFALMLATFLVFLALASLVVSRTVDRIANPWRLLAWTQSLAVVAILTSPALFALPASNPSSPIAYLANLSWRLTLVVGPTILLIGVALPTAWRIATRHAAESGLRVGRLTSLNTSAAVAGSVAAGFVIVPVAGIAPGFVLIAALYAGIAYLCWRRGYGRRRALLAIVAMTLAFAGLYNLRTMRAFVLMVEPDQQLVRLIEGESVNVAVIEDPRLGRILKVNNKYVLGRSDALAVAMQRAQGGLALLLAPDPKSVAFIGVGTAVSVSSIRETRPPPLLQPGDSVERVLAIELLAEVVEATAYFEEANLGVLNDERVEILVADGRNHLFATGESFDAVVGDLFAPWHAGTGYLYSTEHFEAVAARLKEGGVFVQWVPAHQLSVEELRMIVATFLDVFPAAELWLNRPDPRALGGLGLVAFAGDGPTPAVRAAAEASAFFPALQYLCGSQALRRWSAGALLNSDDFPRIEFSAAVSRFRSAEHLREMRSLISQLDQTPDTPSGGESLPDRSQARGGER